MDAVPYDRSNPHPTVLIVGEYLLNFHLGRQPRDRALPRGQRARGHRGAHDRRDPQDLFLQACAVARVPRRPVAARKGLVRHGGQPVRARARPLRPPGRGEPALRAADAHARARARER
jgi:Uncharacterized protein conserved in bacteria